MYLAKGYKVCESSGITKDRTHDRGCKALKEKDEFLFTRACKTIAIKHNQTCTSQFAICALVSMEYYIGLTANYSCSRVTLYHQNKNNFTSALLNVSKHIVQCSRELDPKFSVFPFLSRSEPLPNNIKKTKKPFHSFANTPIKFYLNSHLTNCTLLRMQ